MDSLCRHGGQHIVELLLHLHNYLSMPPAIILLEPQSARTLSQPELYNQRVNHLRRCLHGYRLHYRNPSDIYRSTSTDEFSKQMRRSGYFGHGRSVRPLNFHSACYNIWNWPQSSASAATVIRFPYLPNYSKIKDLFCQSCCSHQNFSNLTCY